MVYWIVAQSAPGVAAPQGQRSNYVSERIGPYPNYQQAENALKGLQTQGAATQTSRSALRIAHDFV